MALIGEERIERWETKIVCLEKHRVYRVYLTNTVLGCIAKSVNSHLRQEGASKRYMVSKQNVAQEWNHPSSACAAHLAHYSISGAHPA